MDQIRNYYNSLAHRDRNFDELWQTSTKAVELEREFMQVMLNKKPDDFSTVLKHASGIEHLHLLKKTPVLVIGSDNDPLIGKGIDEERLLS